MLILGIESATAQVGCAIGGHEGVLASTHSARARRHAESLAPQIEFALSQARIRIDEISVVAVDVGPGLYTGLRVGISTAMATAFGLGVPMIGVGSLDLLAFPILLPASKVPAEAATANKRTAMERNIDANVTPQAKQTKTTNNTYMHENPHCQT